MGENIHYVNFRQLLISFFFAVKILLDWNFRVLFFFTTRMILEKLSKNDLGSKAFKVFREKPQNSSNKKSSSNFIPPLMQAVE